MNPFLLISQANNVKGGSPTIPVPTDFTTYDAATATTTAPTASGQRFWKGAGNGNVGFLASCNNDPSVYSIVTEGDHTYHEVYLEPRTNMLDAESPNYRAEVTRHGPSNNTDPGTIEEWGWGYYFPTGGLKDRTHELSIMQFHTGSAEGYSSNYPCFYIGLAYAGQPQEDGPNAVLNQVVFVDKVWESELERTLGGNHNGRTNTNVIISEGEHHFFKIRILSGNDEIPGGSKGRTTLYHTTVWNASDDDWEIIYDKVSNNIWADVAHGGSQAQVHGYVKLFLYAHSIKTIAELEDDEALNGGTPGSYTITMRMTQHVKCARITPSDPAYYNSSVIKLFDPTRP
jgi:hypothetical protein